MQNDNQSLKTEKLKELQKKAERTELLFSLYFYPGLFAPVAIIMLLVWLKVIESAKWEILSHPIMLGYYALFILGTIYGFYKLLNGAYEIYKLRKSITRKS